MFLSLSAFIIVFSVVVIVHEAGHFIAARAAGAQVDEFSIGFPLSPKLCTLFRQRETAFTLRLLPLGGFVRFATSENASSGNGLDNVGAASRAAIMAAGPVANVACAGLLFALYHLLSGQCTLWHAPACAFHSLAEITTGTFSLVFNLARGHAESGAITGPVGIAAMAAQAMQHGIMAFLYFIGVLSVSLGCMNLLPLPALDGGQLVLLGIEQLRGKPLHARLQQAIGSAGLALFLILTILVTYRDIVTLT